MDMVPNIYDSLHRIKGAQVSKPIEVLIRIIPTTPTVNIQSRKVIHYGITVNRIIVEAKSHSRGR